MTARSLLLLAAIALTACGDDPTGPTSWAGTYTLVSIRGSAIPASVTIPRSEGLATIFRVNAGDMVLDADGTFTTSTNWAVRIVDGTEYHAVPGTFGNGFVYLEGNTVRLTREGEAPASGSLIGSSLSINLAPWGVLVFQKTSK